MASHPVLRCAPRRSMTRAWFGRSTLSRVGVDEETAELVIGHLPQGMAKTYNLYARLAEAPRRARSMGGIRAIAGRRQCGADRKGRGVCGQMRTRTCPPT